LPHVSAVFPCIEGRSSQDHQRDDHCQPADVADSCWRRDDVRARSKTTEQRSEDFPGYSSTRS
jgi:hypothetical protein